MEEKNLFDSNTRDLVSLMEDLANINRKLAVIHTNINGDTKEIEDDFEYMEIQRAIHSAISQVGKVLGSHLSEKFF